MLYHFFKDVHKLGKTKEQIKMSGRPQIKIIESVQTLQGLLKQQTRVLAYNKVQILYLFQSKQVLTVREVSAILGKGETTIHR